MMNNLKLIKDFQTNFSFDDDFVKNSSIIVNRIIIVEINISTFSKIIMFKFMIFMFVSVMSFQLNESKIDQSIALFIFSIVVVFTHDRSMFFNLKKSKFTNFIKKKVELFTEQRQFSFKRNKHIVEEIFKRILLFNTIKLFEKFRLKIDVQLLRAFNVVVAFIFNIKNYFAATCICVKTSNVLRYKINNTRFKINKVILMITKLKRLHEKINNKIYLTH